MWIFLGLVAVVFIILYKRSTEIITVNPLRGRPRPPLPGDDSPKDEREAPTFAGVLGAIKHAVEEAAEEAARQGQSSGAKLPVNMGRAEIIQMARNGQMIEAMQLYRRLYGVDLQTAKKAIDKILLER
ncbi:MAG: hypothetical protein Q8T11_14705 [Elusimicrobiota bacterium]|nr:hypothetical protein [Elusimicrobiota bacterium]